MDEVGREKVISNTLDRLLVFSAILIGAAICYLAGILGILPISILIFGLIFSAVTGKDNALRVTYIFIRTLGYMGFAVAALLAGVSIFGLLWGASSIEILRNDANPAAWLAIFGTFAICFLLGSTALKYLWFKPLSRQLDGLHNLIIRDRNPVPRSPAIMSREALRSFSTADELRKWAKLREEEAISDAEFAEVRRKLLNLDR